MKMYVNPGCRPSAKRLQQALRDRGLNFVRSSRAPRPDEISLNWGKIMRLVDGQWEDLSYPRMINDGRWIRIVGNKYRFLEHCKQFMVGGCTIPWTQDKAEAAGWKQVFCRKTLTGKGGHGIIVVNPRHEELPDCPLYTKSVYKDGEFRVHLGRAVGLDGQFKIIDCQAKVFQKTEERPIPKTWSIRNHANGFVFVRNIEPPAIVKDVARRVGECFAGLHFLALDIIYNARTNLAYVLEGNTAPGLTGHTVDVYANLIKELIDNGEV